VGQLAGGIAHDFNNLLTVIHGQAEMMMEHVTEGDAAYPRLTEIRSAAERAAALTRQLLAFSRRQVLQTKTLDLNRVVANMNQMLSRLIGRNIELAFSPAPALWPVKVDPGQIEQVLMNLAVNARDAMPGGGRLMIETRNISRHENSRGIPHGDFVELRVRDTGHGMDDATKARIFEPFFTTKQTGKGTGLGLAVVYGVVKQSGGQVRVESEPGRGAEFYVYLPRAEELAEDVPEASSGEIPRGSETVLLVEDDESIRHMVRDFLGSQGYKVLSAVDGPEALALIRSGGGIELLLSDLMMPRMSGKDLAQTAKRLRPGLRIILMSGNPEDSQLAFDGVHFLHKPFSIHALATTVRKALDAETRASVAAGSCD
jgi:CheY-like chemotaxis protein